MVLEIVFYFVTSLLYSANVECVLRCDQSYCEVVPYFFFIVNCGMFLIITNIPGMYGFSGCALAFLLPELILCNYVMRFLLLSLWMKSYSVTIQMKATEQYFPVVLFVMLYKVVLTFESVDEILKCDHSNES